MNVSNENMNSNFLQSAGNSPKMAEDYFNSKRRILEGSMEFDDNSGDSAMKIEPEQASPNADDASKATNYHALDELRNLRNIFHEVDDLELTSNMTFPQYLKKSAEERKNLDAKESVSNENTTKQNYSALFCPSGFTIDSFNKEKAADTFSLKVENDTTLKNRNESSMRKSDWLQLIVPKSNLLSTHIAEQGNMKVSSDQGCENEDSSLIELWCKIVNVRTLQSELAPSM
eukprot:CAMPEP_0176443372 /NCGR_PEP_ID=MMETSP0127-20121128/22380_1 /TAXON_ID=938130 /ORGANISM="Platyophrya macrostoma, Strain WH" /LENGTH=229 /DNA_ID=CAMNT_0017828581 /DNA_START=27 /DNA_END=717 /DNA_ORIENTATION=-